MGILLCGLNGVGKSTIGRRLAQQLSYRFIDNEELYFPKNDPSYLFAHPRSRAEVIRLLEAMIQDDDHFIFCAVKGDYGEKLRSKIDRVILVEVPRKTRLERVRARSAMIFGDRLQTDAGIAEKENAWFSTVERRPENEVSDWLSSTSYPVIRIDGTLPVEQNIRYLLSVLSS